MKLESGTDAAAVIGLVIIYGLIRFNDPNRKVPNIQANLSGAH
jgi:hypothetical protein